MGFGEIGAWTLILPVSKRSLKICNKLTNIFNGRVQSTKSWRNEEEFITDNSGSTTKQKRKLIHKFKENVFWTSVHVKWKHAICAQSGLISSLKLSFVHGNKILHSDGQTAGPYFTKDHH